jgi:hypothetical protein
MKNLIELPKVKEFNQEMFNIFIEHDTQIRERIKDINKLFPVDFKINEDCFFEIYREDAHSYKNDGCTKTEGATWSAYWVFPLNGNTKKDYYLGSINGDYCPESIIFHLSDYNERISDKRISGCKFFTLSFNYGEYHDLVNGYDSRLEKQRRVIRLDYQNDNYSKMSILNIKNWSKVFLAAKQLKEAIDTVKLVSKQFK